MKTALISGGTSGIGLAIAHGLLEQDYKIFLIGSNLNKGTEVETAMRSQYPDMAEFIHLDLSNLAAAKKFAGEFIENHNRLDLLANIAGVMEPTRKINNAGIEKTFSVGYVSAFILSTKLAPIIAKAPQGRIVNVGGQASFVLNAKLDFNDLNFSNNYSGFKTAIKTVHAKTVLSEILAKKYKPLGIDVNSFNPGVVRSDLMKNMRWGLKTFFKSLSYLMPKTCKIGIYVCTSPEINGTSGKYFEKKKVINLNFDKTYRERLWKESEELVNGII